MSDIKFKERINLILTFVAECIKQSTGATTVYTILPPGTFNDDVYGFVSYNSGLEFGFEDSGPMSDTISVPVSINIRIKKTSVDDIPDYILTVTELFLKQFYATRHPGNVGYLPQVHSFGGTEVDPNDDYFDIVGSVSMNTDIARTYAEQSDVDILYGSGSP